MSRLIILKRRRVLTFKLDKLLNQMDRSTFNVLNEIFQSNKDIQDISNEGIVWITWI